VIQRNVDPLGATPSVRMQPFLPEAVLTCGWILRLRRVVVGEFEADNFLAWWSFEDFRTTMKGDKFSRVLLETGGN
jgi:hypothetical protein